MPYSMMLKLKKVCSKFNWNKLQINNHVNNTDITRHHRQSWIFSPSPHSTFHIAYPIIKHILFLWKHFADQRVFHRTINLWNVCSLKQLHVVHPQAMPHKRIKFKNMFQITHLKKYNKIFYPWWKWYVQSTHTHLF